MQDDNSNYLLKNRKKNNIFTYLQKKKNVRCCSSWVKLRNLYNRSLWLIKRLLLSSTLCWVRQINQLQPPNWYFCKPHKKEKKNQNFIGCILIPFNLIFICLVRKTRVFRFYQSLIFHLWCTIMKLKKFKSCRAYDSIIGRDCSRSIVKFKY